jgi:hypothetical protein
MATNSIFRGRRPLAALVMIFAAAALFTSAAGAATIHACVKPKSGATRIVGPKAKCRHGEQKLSWNTAGPSGERGTPGASGAPGAEGKGGASLMGTVYAAADNEPHELTEVFFLSKVIPPGSYSISAKTLLVANAATAATTQVLCELLQFPGTSTTGEDTLLDSGGWEASLGEVAALEFAAADTQTLQSTLTSTITSTIALGCADLGGPHVMAASSRIQATVAGAIL